jgi:hypothetical protein
MIDLNHKFKGIPHIYYLNLDCRVDRREHTESNFKYWKIDNYTRVSASNYMLENYDEWKHLIHHNEKLNNKFITIRCAQILSLFKIVENWVKTCNDPYMILMEDDVDFKYLEYMHFDWEYLMNNIPHDWDSILLGFENIHIIPCFLHPILIHHDTGPTLLNRYYAEKLLRLHIIDGKYNFFHKTNNDYWRKAFGNHEFVSGDYFINRCGRSYAIPLMPQKPHMGAHSIKINKPLYNSDILIFAEKLYTIWWTKLRDNYSLKEFFRYGKPNDLFLTRNNVSEYI